MVVVTEERVGSVVLGRCFLTTLFQRKLNGDFWGFSTSNTTNHILFTSIHVLKCGGANLISHKQLPGQVKVVIAVLTASPQ